MTSRPKCDHCEGPSIAFLRYSSQRLCRRHFAESVERRVHKEINQQGPHARGARLAVALSGGKDSIVALQFVHDLVQLRTDLEMVAVTVDEGIAGYRPPSIEVAAEACRGLGVEHRVKRIKDFAGVTMDEVHGLGGDQGQCSFCGVFRRRLMNDFAKEVGADRLVTGHNLDDTAQSILMNLTTANLERMARMGPHDDAKEGLVPRLMPLRSIPESEVYLYALSRGLRWHDEECPYAERALRGVYRDLLYKLEEARPGTRHALLRTHESLRPHLQALTAAKPMRECVRCNEPTSATLCKACEYRQRFAPVTV